MSEFTFYEVDNCLHERSENADDSGKEYYDGLLPPPNHRWIRMVKRRPLVITIDEAADILYSSGYEDPSVTRDNLRTMIRGEAPFSAYGIKESGRWKVRKVEFLIDNLFDIAAIESESITSGFSLDNYRKEHEITPYRPTSYAFRRRMRELLSKPLFGGAEHDADNNAESADTEKAREKVFVSEIISIDDWQDLYENMSTDVITIMFMEGMSKKAPRAFLFPSEVTAKMLADFLMRYTAHGNACSYQSTYQKIIKACARRNARKDGGRWWINPRGMLMDLGFSVIEPDEVIIEDCDTGEEPADLISEESREAIRRADDAVRTAFENVHDQPEIADSGEKEHENVVYLLITDVDEFKCYGAFLSRGAADEKADSMNEVLAFVSSEVKMEVIDVPIVG